MWMACLQQHNEGSKAGTFARIEALTTPRPVLQGCKRAVLASPFLQGQLLPQQISQTIHVGGFAARVRVSQKFRCQPWQLPRIWHLFVDFKGANLPCEAEVDDGHIGNIILHLNAYVVSFNIVMSETFLQHVLQRPRELQEHAVGVSQGGLRLKELVHCSAAKVGNNLTCVHAHADQLLHAGEPQLVEVDGLGDEFLESVFGERFDDQYLLSVGIHDFVARSVGARTQTLDPRATHVLYVAFSEERNAVLVQTPLCLCLFCGECLVAAVRLRVFLAFVQKRLFLSFGTGCLLFAALLCDCPGFWFDKKLPVVSHSGNERKGRTFYFVSSKILQIHFG
ncbi:hypothetical protein E2C01_035998 [Portunus trituberculatus]|uniref:Uncharacterized protein n=1 Tax=Portunus trituberculatus TaxID=210409 RepID=A0A5B7FA05_PORTR|nr:hypothetical protein [Portunus trituberculatus]